MERLYNRLDQIILLNNGSYTHFDIKSGHQSLMGFTFASSTITDDLEWTVADDNPSSDHYLIHINFLSATNDMPYYPQKWLLNKADWGKYHDALANHKNILLSLTSIMNLTANNIIGSMTEVITAAANDSISKSSGVVLPKSVP